MKKKICILFLGCILLYGCAVGVPYWIEAEVSRRLDLMEVVVAAKDIPPRTIIDESHLSTIVLPSSYVDQKAYVSAADVVGLISNSRGFIPSGSLFYFTALEEKSAVSDGVLMDLKEGQVLVALETNLVQLGANALKPNQVVDVYVTLEDKERHRVFSELLRRVRILGIKDYLGIDLQDPQSSGSPHVLQLAISTEALPILLKAADLGEIRYTATKDAYVAEDECEIVWDSKAMEILGIEKSPQ